MKIRHPVATSVALAWLALPAPVAADCQPAPPLAQAIVDAPLVFVGTVMEIGPAQRAGNARFHVEDVWVGHLRETVTVYGLSGERFGEDDRTWEVGARYLVVPIVDGNVLRDSMCSATTEWQPALATLRPVQGSAPMYRFVDLPLLPLLVIATFVAVLASAFVGYDWYARRQSGREEE